MWLRLLLAQLPEDVDADVDVGAGVGMGEDEEKEGGKAALKVLQQVCFLFSFLLLSHPSSPSLIFSNHRSLDRTHTCANLSLSLPVSVCIWFSLCVAVCLRVCVLACACRVPGVLPRVLSVTPSVALRLVSLPVSLYTRTIYLSFSISICACPFASTSSLSVSPYLQLSSLQSVSLFFRLGFVTFFLSPELCCSFVTFYFFVQLSYPLCLSLSLARVSVCVWFGLCGLFFFLFLPLHPSFHLARSLSSTYEEATHANMPFFRSCS